MLSRNFSVLNRTILGGGEPTSTTASLPNQLHQVMKNELRAGAGVPLSVHRFMELGLSHPEHGYYSTKDRIFNKGGDFTTSPEISQMFGESLGIWIV